MKEEPYLDLGLENEILQNNDIFAILDYPWYRIRSSGTIKYGNIKFYLIRKKWDFRGLEDEEL
jgi:hypothetical protein